MGARNPLKNDPKILLGRKHYLIFKYGSLAVEIIIAVTLVYVGYLEIQFQNSIKGCGDICVANVVFEEAFLFNAENHSEDLLALQNFTICDNVG